MKVITQMLPNGDEILLNNLRIENYVLDQDTYAYFLRLFEKEFGEYVFKKTGGKKFVPLIEDAQRSILPGEAIRVIEDWGDMTKKYFKKFNELRPRYYLYNEKIYSYTYMGSMNVGQEVEVWEYDNEDLIQLLNFKKRKKVFD